MALGVRSCVVFERRGREWGFAFLYTAFVAAAWVICETLGGENRSVRVTTMLIAGVATLAWPFLMWRWLPWSARVRIDMDEGVCHVVYRFFLVPCRRYKIAIDSRKFSWGTARIDYTKTVTEDRSDSLGCILSLALGPLLGPLVTPQTKTEVDVSERRNGLVLRSVADGSMQLVVAIKDRDSVEEALITIEQCMF